MGQRPGLVSRGGGTSPGQKDRAETGGKTNVKQAKPVWPQEGEGPRVGLESKAGF